MKKMSLLLTIMALSANTFAQERIDLEKLLNKESQKKQAPSKKVVATDKNSIDTTKSIDNSKIKFDIKAMLNKINNKNFEAKQKALLSTGGSAIGGGNLYTNLVAWCDDGFDILDETRIEAQDTIGIYNDKVSALRTYYFGLITALEAAGNDEINVYSSITYRSIVRGLNLAQYFGVLDILEGRVNSNDPAVMDALYFLSDYYQFILTGPYQLDRSYYLNYYTTNNCSNCDIDTRYSVAELEKTFINYSTSQIDFWLKKFIKYSSNDENSYSTVDVRKTMISLAYLTSETALDLEESLLNNVFACQSRQLSRLSSRINRYLTQSPDGSLDAAKLTIFKEQAKNIVKNIQQQTCHF